MAAAASLQLLLLFFCFRLAFSPLNTRTNVRTRVLSFYLSKDGSSTFNAAAYLFSFANGSSSNFDAAAASLFLFFFVLGTRNTGTNVRMGVLPVFLEQ